MKSDRICIATVISFVIFGSLILPSADATTSLKREGKTVSQMQKTLRQKHGARNTVIACYHCSGRQFDEFDDIDVKNYYNDLYPSYVRQ